MEKVTGVGGIFFKADNPMELQKWYQENLGLPIGSDGYTLFRWRDADVPERTGETVWSLFPKDTGYFAPSPASCMINHRVENLERMLAQLREAGVTIAGEMVEEYGRFAWS
jgi:lactoylglutathione lyase